MLLISKIWYSALDVYNKNLLGTAGSGILFIHNYEYILTHTVLKYCGCETLIQMHNEILH